MKCFSIGLNPKFARHVQFLYMEFDPTLTEVLEQMQKDMGEDEVMMLANYPHQVSRHVRKYQYIWRTASKKNMKNYVVIANTEILRRRNKKNDPCVTNWKHFDNVLMNEHINRIGCGSPYLNHKKPICSSHAKIKESRYDFNAIGTQYPLKPCQEMINVDIQYLDVGYYVENDTSIWLTIEYPLQIKMITQAQSVDLHALIGSIGGYIGLFLGRNLINVTFFSNILILII